MNAHEQEIARAIAPVVRRECREVGLTLGNELGWLLLVGHGIEDGRPVWVDRLAPDLSTPIVGDPIDGIPDLSDGACLDALIRWLATRRARIVPAPDEFLCFWHSALYVAQMKSLHRARADAIHAACRALWPEEVGDA